MAVRKVFICLQSGLLILISCVHLSQSEENVSVGKAATQSSIHDNWNASKAVDGCLNRDLKQSGCCAHTNTSEMTEAWWQVDLGSLNTISYITITHRSDYDSRRRFAGYQLNLSNTTDWTQGVLCFEDESSTINQVQMLVTHQCPYVAQYVTISLHRGDPMRHSWYERRAMLELCEVQVFGCPIGKHGDGTCDQTCPDNCYGGNCDASTGSCFYCPARKQEEMCDLGCALNCKDRLCDEDTGFRAGTDSQVIVIAVLASMCALMLVAFITLEVCLFRKIRNKKDSADKNEEPHNQDQTYTSLSGTQQINPNFYEMLGTE